MDTPPASRGSAGRSGEAPPGRGTRRDVIENREVVPVAAPGDHRPYQGFPRSAQARLGHRSPFDTSRPQKSQLTHSILPDITPIPYSQYQPDSVTKATKFSEDGTNAPQTLLSRRAHTDSGHAIWPGPEQRVDICTYVE